MTTDLESYTHLNYKNSNSSELTQDSFVNFLYVNTEAEFPEIDENKAWEKCKRGLEAKKSDVRWLRIAASITIFLGFIAAIYVMNATPNQVEVVSLDKKVNVQFPDGSTGVLNANSSFSYPEQFEDERRVVFTGEAYFDVKKSNKPFIIETNGVEVKVLGTAFNLMTSDSEVILYVDRGLVAFSKNGTETKVSAGKEAIFNNETNVAVIRDIPSPNIMSWRSGFFQFDDTPLEQALSELGAYYNVTFKLNNSRLKSCRISVTIDKKSLKEVTRLLESILDVKTEIRDNFVKISGKGC